MRKIDLCEECADDVTDFSTTLPLETVLNPSWSEKMLMHTQGRDLPYSFDAYALVHETICSCLEMDVEKQESEIIRDVSGQQLLQAIRNRLLQKHGKMAQSVLANWKIFKTDDFGEIVYEMVDARIFSLGPKDSKNDFHDVFKFKDAFPES